MGHFMDYQIKPQSFHTDSTSDVNSAFAVPLPHKILNTCQYNERKRQLHSMKAAMLVSLRSVTLRQQSAHIPEG
jgi:hypothetical protein